MKRNVAFFFAVTAALLGTAAAKAADFPNGAAFDLSGVRHCPAPDCDNGEFLDTYYSVDAQTGRLTAHTGDNAVGVDDSHLDSGEATLLVAPNGNYENRFVPPSGLRADNAHAAPNPGGASGAYGSYAPPASSRDGRAVVANDDGKVPWWKGGMWRNRGNGRGGNDDDDSPPPSSRSSSSSSGTARAPRMLDDDDMWDDDEDEGEYSGYNPDGSFGRPSPAAQQAANRTPPPPRREPANDPYSAPPPAGGIGGGASAGYDDGYAGPPAPQTYADPYAPAPAMGGQIYSDPYAPASYGSPDPYSSGSFYDGGPIDTSMYGGTTVYREDGTSTFLDGGSYNAGGYGGSAGYGGSTYGAPGYPASSYDAGYSAPPPPPVGGTPDPFSSAPPSYQGEPSIDAQGSPQFENAVRLVKDNRFSEAKSILASETSRNPSNASAWRWLADCHYNLLELDDAVNCYQRALERDPNDYYALRGQGFSYLHRGHEYWRQMQEQVGRGQKDNAAQTFAQAHDNYKKSLELLGLCLRRAPDDDEAVYGEAMAAEGASRKLYSNAISYLKLGPEQRERAELFAENCVTVINKGIERSKEKAKLSPGDAGPRALLGGLYMRKAILFNQLGRTDQALMELRNARDVQKSILDEIDKNNATAQKNLRECEMYWEQWGGNRQ